MHKKTLPTLPLEYTFMPKPISVPVLFEASAVTSDANNKAFRLDLTELDFEQKSMCLWSKLKKVQITLNKQVLANYNFLS